MLEYLKNESDMTRTENGGAAYSTTGSDCLDLFATVGGLRRADESEIISRFTRAYVEDPDTAMKLIFFARDVRGGLGERRVFRTALRWLAFNKPESVRKNLRFVAEYGRYDDLLSLVGTPCEDDALSIVRSQLENDLASLGDGKSVSLLAKWLPSVNATSDETKKLGKRVARALGMTDAGYRKTLSALRAKIRIIENDLRTKNYTFDYEKQPSRALFKYRQAFRRNDLERYNAFLKAASKGEKKLHADNVAPYELVEPYLREQSDNSFMKDVTPEEAETLNATWASMPDFGGDENALAVIDTSGSMYWSASPLPAAVALSLGLYFAERNKGAFRNTFIEFSDRPQLIEIKGDTFADRLRYVASFNEIASTDLESVFALILSAAVRNSVSQAELPAKLVVISDMEFNSCVENADETVFNSARAAFAEHGYKLPEVVFWNVASRNRQLPVKQNEQGVALVSGVTPRLFGMIAGGGLSPLKFMTEVLESERYAVIAA